MSKQCDSLVNSAPPAGGPEGPLATYTILTTDAAPQLTWLHNRMPVILPNDEAVAAWLGCGTKPTAAGCGHEAQQEITDKLQQQQQQQDVDKEMEEGVKTEQEHAERDVVDPSVTAAAGGGALSLKSIDQVSCATVKFTRCCCSYWLGLQMHAIHVYF